MSANSRWRVPAWVFAWVAAAVIVAGYVAMAGTAARADDRSTVSTADATVVTQNFGSDATCSDEGACKRVNWCDYQDGHDTDAPAVDAQAVDESVADDAPTVALEGKDDEGPRCLQKPRIRYECCAEDHQASLVVKVYNPNHHKLRLALWLDDNEPLTRWVEGEDTTQFVFDGLQNGGYTLHAAVWTGHDQWCEFREKHVTVDCVKPTPTATPTPTPTVAPITHTTPPTLPSTKPVGEQLPVTGPDASVAVIVGTALLFGGAIMVILPRVLRRRSMQ